MPRIDSFGSIYDDNLRKNKQYQIEPRFFNQKNSISNSINQSNKKVGKPILVVKNKHEEENMSIFNISPDNGGVEEDREISQVDYSSGAELSD